mmetsp:Transcript_99670/g.297744  ORF Transcript_99670/g.297744 Transcript_99670/m.297744 type:complete len:298 (+) Transcript_99670:673-1566(+)
MRWRAATSCSCRTRSGRARSSSNAWRRWSWSLLARACRTSSGSRRWRGSWLTRSSASASVRLPGSASAKRSERDWTPNGRRWRGGRRCRSSALGSCKRSRPARSVRRPRPRSTGVGLQRPMARGRLRSKRGRRQRPSSSWRRPSAAPPSSASPSSRTGWLSSRGAWRHRQRQPRRRWWQWRATLVRMRPRAPPPQTLRVLQAPPKLRRGGCDCRWRPSRGSGTRCSVRAPVCRIGSPPSNRSMRAAVLPGARPRAVGLRPWPWSSASRRHSRLSDDCRRSWRRARNNGRPTRPSATS